MAPINVVINGVLGRMGQEVLKAVSREPDMRVTGAADLKATGVSLPSLSGTGTIPLASSLDRVLAGADVAVDFTNYEGAIAAIRAAASQKVNVVIGSTGLSEGNIKEAEDLAKRNGVGVVIAPNFALGAVLMIHLAKIAGRFFDYADLTEMHHENKMDAPSGTALAIARAAAAGKGNTFTCVQAQKEIVPGTRGGMVQGVSIHSVRMPGRVAHHELVFGALGQTLTIRHDSINRESFMPGVILAVRYVISKPGVTLGLEKILEL